MSLAVPPFNEELKTRPLRQRAIEVAEVAAQHAGVVDRDARFPIEAFEALKAARMMSVMVPTDLGGEGATVSEIAAVCHLLGRSCGATAMVYAMHQLVVASVVFHGLRIEWQRALLKRLVVEQLLFASATTEAGVGGDVRRSLCALERHDGHFKVTKEASVISYGKEADGILVTARRNPDAAPSDQVAMIVVKDDYRLEPSGDWDTLGMRGTCSGGFILHATGTSDQILPEPYSDLLARTGMPMAHLLWSSVWLGIATDSVARARAFLRNEMKKKPSGMPASAPLLAQAVSQLDLTRSNLASALRRYESDWLSRDALSSGAFSIAMNGVKIGTSQMAIQIVGHALHICGLAGYRNSGDYSVSRHIRDLLSAPLMIHNDRILANNANMLLVQQFDSDLFA